MIAMARAWIFLVAFSARRQLFGKKTVVAALLVAVACGLTLLAGKRRALSADFFGEAILLGLYLNFILPVSLVGYGASALGDERDDGTLVYLLTRPIGRAALYLAKYLAALPSGLAVGLGGLGLLCASGAARAGPSDAERIGGIFLDLWPAFALGCAAYVALFHLLAALTRHATILSIVYVLFIEILVGNFPGIIKRISIHFYLTSVVLEDGRALGAEVAEDLIVLPVSSATAHLCLGAAAAILAAAGAVVFARREYREA